jgi:hypothetical protein
MEQKRDIREREVDTPAQPIIAPTTRNCDVLGSTPQLQALVGAPLSKVRTPHAGTLTERR